jgi:hypothetical protein
VKLRIRTEVKLEPDLLGLSHTSGQTINETGEMVGRDHQEKRIALEEDLDPFLSVNPKSSTESYDVDIFKVNGLVGTGSWLNLVFAPFNLHVTITQNC